MALTFIRPEISYGAVKRREPKIYSVKFDDGGYELRMKRGMNADLSVWDIPINVLPIAVADGMEGFLAAHGGVDWFWWVPPRETQPKKFICRRWTREPVQGSKTHDKFTMTFEEVADIA
jgi:phage-related protein